MLTPPPPKILAVEGQTVTVTSSYKGDYITDELQAFWIIKTPNSEYPQYVYPNNDDPYKEYNITIQECPNRDCCHFDTSIVFKTVSLNQSGTELESAGARPSDLSRYTPGYSKIGEFNYGLVNHCVLLFLFL